MKEHLKKASEIQSLVLKLVEGMTEEFKEVVDAGGELCENSVCTIQLFTSLALIHAQLEQLQELG